MQPSARPRCFQPSGESPSPVSRSQKRSDSYKSRPTIPGAWPASVAAAHILRRGVTLDWRFGDRLRMRRSHYAPCNRRSRPPIKMVGSALKTVPQDAILLSGHRRADTTSRLHAACGRSPDIARHRAQPSLPSWAPNEVPRACRSLWITPTPPREETAPNLGRDCTTRRPGRRIHNHLRLERSHPTANFPTGRASGSGANRVHSHRAPARSAVPRQQGLAETAHLTTAPILGSVCR
jgi:hypothetical protein